MFELKKINKIKLLRTSNLNYVAGKSAIYVELI